MMKAYKAIGFDGALDSDQVPQWRPRAMTIFVIKWEKTCLE
jgi:hypothetical protein